MSKRKAEDITVKPDGLYVIQNAVTDTDNLLDFFSGVQWFQRFGKQYPNTAHYNGYHCMAQEHIQIENVVKEAMHLHHLQEL